MENTVISFKKVSKKFRKGRKLLLKEALLDVLKPAATEEFWALKNASFNVNKGETLGIIGANGSGKSTILKLIAGVMVPTGGEVEIKGRVAPLIELGAGFHPELTGRENIYLNASILGMKHSEIDERYKDIVKFSELDEFIDTPIKHYSSGMYMRLGFSIAVHTNPDILLVDEILAVGDTKFQTKCMKKIESFRKEGITVIFVTHDMKTIRSFCNRAIVLKNGKAIFRGNSKKASLVYEEN